MKILFDQGVPAPLRQALAGHEIKTAFECGWQRLGNGELISSAEADGFDLLITTDQNLRYQQNLADRSLAVLVLSTTDWRRIRLSAALVSEAVQNIESGAFVELAIPSGV